MLCRILKIVLLCAVVATPATMLARSAPDGERIDNRVALTRPAVENYEKAVGQIRAKASDRTRHCTATAIAPRFVLTVVHCLFNDLGRPYGKIDFFPGSRAQDSEPFGKFPVLRYHRPVRYELGRKTALNLRYDLAIVEVGLNAKGQGLNEAAAIVSFRAASLSGREIMTMLGYPNDKELYGAYIQRGCSFRLFAGILYRTDCYATKGQSGSPVLVHETGSGQHYVQAVISGVTRTASFATRITPERESIFESIISGRYARGKPDAAAERWQMYYVGTVPQDAFLWLD